MRNPVSLFSFVLAAIVLAAPALPADHKATAKSRPTHLPTWETVGESTWSWRAISFEDETGKTHPLWCRRDECAWNQKSARPVNLYVLQREKTEYYDYRKNPEDLPVKSAKAYYTTFLSMYKLDVSQTPHRAVVPGASLAFDIHDVESRLPEGYRMFVPPPTQVAEDRPASDAALSEGDLAALDKIKDAGGKTQKDYYQAEVKGRLSIPTLRRAAAKYRGLVPKSSDSPSSGALTPDEIAKLPPDEASQYIKDVLAASGDPAKLIPLYKASRDKIAAADKKPESPVSSVTPPKNYAEFLALSEAQKKTYCRGLQLEETTGGAPPIVASKNALEKARRTAKCSLGDPSSDQGCLTNEFEGKDDGVAVTPNISDKTNAVDKRIKTACSALLASEKPVVQPLAKKKKNDSDIANLKGPTKIGTDTEGGKKDEKKDPNAWLAVKTGAVGAIPGALVGTFFGPVGILVGAAIGFALFWGVSKLTKD